MKNILSILALSLTFTAFAHASTKTDLERVRFLADQKIAGKDVVKKISIVHVQEGDDCGGAPGVNYVVEVRVRKSEVEEAPNGDPKVTRKWQDWNTYYISQDELLKGGNLSDTPCLE